MTLKTHTNIYKEINRKLVHLNKPGTDFDTETTADFRTYKAEQLAGVLGLKVSELHEKAAKGEVTTLGMLVNGQEYVRYLHPDYNVTERSLKNEEE